MNPHTQKSEVHKINIRTTESKHEHFEFATTPLDQSQYSVNSNKDEKDKSA